MRVVLAAALFLAGLAPATFAARPLVTNDPLPQEHHKIQIEAGLDYGGRQSTHHLSAPLTITYGLLPEAEVALTVGAQLLRTRDERGEHILSDYSDVGVATKFILLRQEQVGLDVGGSLSVGIPVARESRGLASGVVTGDATFIIGRKVTQELSVFGNIGWSTSDGGGLGDFLHYSLAATYQLTPVLQPVAELFASSPTYGNGETFLGFTVGLRIQAAENLTLDVAMGSRIVGSGADVTATIGVTWIY